MHQSCAYFAHDQVPKAKPVGSRIVPFFALAAQPFRGGFDYVEKYVTNAVTDVVQDAFDTVRTTKWWKNANRKLAEFIMPAIDTSNPKAKVPKLRASTKGDIGGYRVVRGEGDEVNLVDRHWEPTNQEKALLPSPFYARLDAERQEMILQHFLANEPGQPSLAGFASATAQIYSTPFYLRLGPAKGNFFQQHESASSEDCDYVQRWLVVIPPPPAEGENGKGGDDLMPSEGPAPSSDDLQTRIADGPEAFPIRESINLDPAVDGPGATLDCTTPKEALQKRIEKCQVFLSGLSRTSLWHYVAKYVTDGGAFFVARKKDAGHRNFTLAIADADQVRKCGMAFENCSIDIVPPPEINKTFVDNEETFDQELQDFCPGCFDFEDAHDSETEAEKGRIPVGLAVYSVDQYYHPGIVMHLPQATYEFHMGRRGVSVWERPNPSTAVWKYGKHVKDEAIGEITASKSEIWRLISIASWSSFTGDTYHMIDTNCSHFAETIFAELGVKAEIPAWINRVATWVSYIPGSSILGGIATRYLQEQYMKRNCGRWRILKSAAPEPDPSGCGAACE